MWQPNLHLKPAWSAVQVTGAPSDDDDDEVVTYNHGAASETLLDILARLRGNAPPRARSKSARPPPPRAPYQPSVACMPSDDCDDTPQPPQSALRHDFEPEPMPPLPTRRSDDFANMFDVWVPEAHVHVANKPGRLSNIADGGDGTASRVANRPVTTSGHGREQTSAVVVSMSSATAGSGIVAQSVLAAHRAAALRENDNTLVSELLQRNSGKAPLATSGGLPLAATVVATAESAMDRFMRRPVTAAPPAATSSREQNHSNKITHRQPPRVTVNPTLPQRTILDLQTHAPAPLPAPSTDPLHRPPPPFQPGRFTSDSSRHAFSRLLDRSIVPTDGDAIRGGIEDLLRKAAPPPNPHCHSVVTHGFNGRGSGPHSDKHSHPIADDALARVEHLFEQWELGGSKPAFRARVASLRNRLGVVVVRCIVTWIADLDSHNYHPSVAHHLAVGQPCVVILSASVQASAKVIAEVELDVGRPVAVTPREGALPPMVWPGACVRVRETAANPPAAFRYPALLNAAAGAADNARTPSASQRRAASTASNVSARADRDDTWEDGMLDGFPVGPGDSWAVCLADVQGLLEARAPVLDHTDGDTYA